jgi:glycosyltransferase involved in cell wall biosynthesis
MQTRVGLFALNLTPQSGGSFSLFAGLARHAALSANRVTVLASADVPLPPCSGAADIRRAPKVSRWAVQAAGRLAALRSLTSSRLFAGCFYAMLAGRSPSFFRDMDVWVWPHCFSPVPNLGRTVAFCLDLIHTHYPQYFSQAQLRRRRAGESSLKDCAAVVCISRSTANDLLRLHPHLADRVHIVTLAPSVGSLKCSAEEEQRIRDKAGAPFFLYTAACWPHKNHGLLFDATEQLRALTARPFRILLAGHRRTNELVRQIRRRGLENLVLDLGPVSDAELAACYRAATAFVFPSQFEGFGIPLVEAMQSGLPILASGVSSIPEVCGDSAKLLPADRPEAWAAAMRDLLEDSALRRRQSEFAALRGRDYSWERTWRELDEVVFRVTG